MACRPTSGTTYDVLTFVLTPRDSHSPDAAGDDVARGVLCLEARIAARWHRGSLHALHPSPDQWRRIARDLSSGLGASALPADSPTATLLVADDALDVRLGDGWRIEAADEMELVERIARRLLDVTSRAARHGRAS